MAGRGFQIKEKLLLNFCSLEVPLGAQMKSHVERAIVLIVSKVIEYWKIPISLL